MSSAAPPAISVVMPVYNRAALVGRAIGSVLAQEFSDFELIVVDDGSSDGTAERVAEVADPRVGLVRLAQNGGGNAARNRGIREARAPIIAFIDSDDHYLPHKLGWIVGAFAARPEVGAILDSFIKVYPPADGRPDAHRRNPVIDDNDALLDALFRRRIWKATTGIAARREAILRAGLFDETLKRRQDYDFILRLIAVTTCVSTDQLLWVKTNSPDAISADVDSHLSSILAFHDRHPAYHQHRAYRDGLALDSARHFNRIFARRRLARVPGDAWSLVRRFGAIGAAAMLASGWRMLLKRKSAARVSRAADRERDA